MDGFWSSCLKWFKEKTSSPLYFTYFGFFIAWNWKFFQIVFLESASLFQKPRVEYINSELLFSFSNIYVGLIANFIWRVGPPAIFTYLAIVYLPILQKWALSKYLESRFERRRIFETKQREHDEWLLAQEKTREKILEQFVEVKQRQVKSEKEIRATLTDEKKWEMEYQEFEGSQSFYKFRQVIETVYKYGGVIETVKNYQQIRYVDANALAMAHTRDLISYVGGNRNIIELTSKGKIFAKLYLDKHSI